MRKGGRQDCPRTRWRFRPTAPSTIKPARAARGAASRQGTPGGEPPPPVVAPEPRRLVCAAASAGKESGRLRLYAGLLPGSGRARKGRQEAPIPRRRPAAQEGPGPSKPGGGRQVGKFRRACLPPAPARTIAWLLASASSGSSPAPRLQPAGASRPALRDQSAAAAERAKQVVLAQARPNCARLGGEAAARGLTRPRPSFLPLGPCGQRPKGAAAAGPGLAPHQRTRSIGMPRGAPRPPADNPPPPGPGRGLGAWHGRKAGFRPLVFAPRPGNTGRERQRGSVGEKTKNKNVFHSPPHEPGRRAHGRGGRQDKARAGPGRAGPSRASQPGAALVQAYAA